MYEYMHVRIDVLKRCQNTLYTMAQINARFFTHHVQRCVAAHLPNLGISMNLKSYLRELGMWILAMRSGVLCGTLHEFVKGLKILVVVFTFPHGIIQPATSATSATSATARAVYVRLADSSHSVLL